MSKKIMIVDDEEDMRIYLQTLFRKAGYATDIAVNGDDALKRIKDIQPDLITLDILMPQKSGLNCFDGIRATLGFEYTPVFVISGVTGHSDFFEKEKLVGPTFFIEKPIDPENLVARVQEILNGN